MTVTEVTNRTHGCRVTVPCLVCVPAYNGGATWTAKEIDVCLGRLVNALNQAGAITASCCCGHGVGPGCVILQDGTQINLPRCTKYPQ